MLDLVWIPPRLRLLFRLAWLVFFVFVVARADPPAGTAGRSLAVSLVLAVAAIAWLTWSFADNDGAPAELMLAGLGTAGSVLVGLSPNSAASAFAFVAVVASAIRLPWERSTRVLAVTISALAIAALAFGRDATGAIAYSAGLGAAYLAGVNRRQAVQRAEQAERLLEAEQRSRDAAVRTGALDERARIARELHDVLAHALAGLVIQLEAADAQLAGGAERDVVRERLQRAQALAREGLEDARGAVATLRGDAPELSDRLAALAPGHVRVEGDPAALSVETARVLVRAAQEAVTNVAKHAPGAEPEIALRCRDGEARLRVSNGAATQPAESGGLATSGGGYGLRGMRERVEALGGTVSAGPDGGGWVVEVRLPA